MKKAILAILMASLMIAVVFSAVSVNAADSGVQKAVAPINTASASITSAYAKPYDDFDYYLFEDVDVKVSGRCRGISCAGYPVWTGGLYIGHLEGAGADAFDTPRERLKIEIKDNAGTILFSKVFTCGNIHANDAEGIFYWSEKEQFPWGPPAYVYINCHAKGSVGIAVKKGSEIESLQIDSSI